MRCRVICRAILLRSSWLNARVPAFIPSILSLPELGRHAEDKNQQVRGA